MRLRSRSQYSNSLRVGRDRVQTHVNVRFSVPVKTGPRAQTASSAMVTGSFSPEVNQPGRVDHASQVQERTELYLCSPSVLRMVQGEFYHNLYTYRGKITTFLFITLLGILSRFTRYAIGILNEYYMHCFTLFSVLVPYKFNYLHFQQQTSSSIQHLSCYNCTVPALLYPYFSPNNIISNK